MSEENLRCWPGCLAMLNSRTEPQQNGRVVRVVRRTVPNDEVYGFDWQASGEPSWVVEPLFNQLCFNYREPYKQVPCRDASLIPFPPKISDRIEVEIAQPA